MPVYLGSIAQGAAQGLDAAQLRDMREQQLKKQQYDLEMSREANARQLQAQQASAQLLGGFYKAPPPVSGQQAPQPPMPGQASVPMQPPEQAGPPMSAMQGQQPAMQAGPNMGPPASAMNQPPPQIPPYQTVASAGQRAQQPTPSAGPIVPPNAGGIPPAPAAPAADQGNQLTIKNIVGKLQENGVPQSQWLGVLEQMKPYMDMENRQELNAMRMQHQLTADENARLRTELYGKNVGSLIASREGGGGGAGGAGAGGGESLKSVGGMIAAGVPLNQAVPGLGKQAVAARTQARNEAIRQIIEQNPGMTAEQAGVELANREIAYKAGNKAQGMLTTQLAGTQQAVKQLDFNIDSAKKEMAKLGSTDLSPILNQIARGAEKWTGDPKYSSLFYFMSATAQESARILAGGTGSVAQLHAGAAEEARKWANIGMTPASFDAVAKAMKAEGQARIKSYQDTIKDQQIGSGGTSSNQKTVNWSDLK